MQPLYVRSYKWMSAVSAPLDDAPFRACSNNVAVFHFFRGLPLKAIIFIFLNLSFYIAGFLAPWRGDLLGARAFIPVPFVQFIVFFQHLWDRELIGAAIDTLPAFCAQKDTLHRNPGKFDRHLG